jgi:hypothetical protein
VRDLIHDFHNSRYASCLAHLAALRPVLALDIHAHDHSQVTGQERFGAQATARRGFRGARAKGSGPAPRATDRPCRMPWHARAQRAGPRQLHAGVLDPVTCPRPSAPHPLSWQALYNMIRHRALVQYTTPYSSVSLAAMASAFGSDTA